MCGIVGVITKNSFGFDGDDIEWFKQMLVMDSLRGVDGTGIAIVHRDQSSVVAKVASHPYRLLNYVPAKNAISSAFNAGRLMVGHNRKATVGQIKNENAHPFVKDHIILVHNGRVGNAEEIAKTEVDSEVMAHLLAEEDDVPKALGRVYGDFALAWYNAKLHKLFLTRNESRPLYIGETDRAIYFSSERWMMYGAFYRTYPAKSELKDVREVKPNELIAIDLRNLQRDSLEVSLDLTKKQHRGPDQATLEAFRAWYEQLEKPEPMTTSQAAPATHSHSADTTTSTKREEKAVLEIPVFRKSTAPAATSNLKAGDRVVCSVLCLDPKEVTDRNGEKYSRYQLSGRLLGNDGSTLKEICRVWLPKDVDSVMVDGIVAAGKFEGIVKAPVWSGDSVSYWLRDVKEYIEPKTIKTYNGTLFQPKQWYDLCANSKCSTCGGALSVKYPKYTSVQIHNGPEVAPRILCPECIVTKFVEWGQSTQEQIVRNNGYSPLDYLVEKRAEEGASCH